MKIKTILFLGLAMSCFNLKLTAMVDPSALSFIPAEKDEDLSEYQSILKKTYQGHGGEGSENYISTSLDRTFPIVAGWIGNKGKRFVKILDGEKPVGFLTLESLDDEETHVAFHQSPLLPEYKSAYSRFFECVKKEFPQAKKVSTTCSSRLPKLQKVIEQFGFEQDDFYAMNEEFAAVFDAEELEDFTGYTKELD